MHKSTKMILLPVLAISIFSLAGCETEKSAMPATVGCQKHPAPTRGPVVLPQSPQKYVVRWETKTKDSFEQCLTVTNSDGATATPKVIRIEHVVDNDNPYSPSDEDYPVTRYLHEAVVETPAATDYTWRLQTEGQAVTGLIKLTDRDQTHVALIGDSNQEEKEGTKPITKTLLDLIVASKATMLLHAGDIVYNVYGGKWDNFFDTYRSLFAHMPMLPALGNHEYEFPGESLDYSRPYLTANPQGEDGGRTMVVDSGPVRFIALDSNFGQGHSADPDSFSEAHNNAMWKAVEDALASAGDKIKVVMFHHPVYTLSQHLPIHALRAKMIELDEAHDINFVFNGHNHVYERFNIPERFHTLVSGGGGAPKYKTPDADNDDADSALYLQFGVNEYHWIDLVFSRSGLDLMAIDLNGDVLEKTSLDIR